MCDCFGSETCASCDPNAFVGGVQFFTGCPSESQEDLAAELAPDVYQLQAEHAAGTHDVYEPGCPTCESEWAKTATPEQLAYNAYCPECRLPCATSALDCGGGCVAFNCDNCGAEVAQGHGPSCERNWDKIPF